jgi:hypothetical protein
MQITSVIDQNAWLSRLPSCAARRTTLAGMLQRLRAPAGALVAMDRGIATEDNLRWLREQGYRYLVVSRERQRQFDPNEASDLQSASGERVSVQRIEDAEAKARYSAAIDARASP